MKNLRYSDTQLFEAFVKSAQYLVRLNSQQDVWDHLAKFIATYFPADWTALVERDSADGVAVRHCTLPDEAAARIIRTDEVKTLIADVLDSGFLASRVILTPEPSMTTFLPIAEEHKVILIGHETAEPLPKELLNTYLAIAGLAGTTFERLRAESMLKRLAYQNKLILDSAGEGILGMDALGRHTFANPAAARMLGWEVEELIGGQSHPLWHHTRADGSPYPEEECNIHASSRHGAAHHESDEVFWKKDGTAIPVEYTSTPVWEDGKSIGVVVTFNDITERKRAEDEIKRLNEDLEKRVVERTTELTAVNKELEAFTYSVSHDLRAPLRHIHGFVDLLVQHSSQNLDDKGRRYLTTISKAASQMGNLVDDLLTFSRMGRTEVKKNSIDMESLVYGVINEMKYELGERDVEWKVGRLAPVYGDPSLLRLVMVNLLSNAVKFTRKVDKAVIEIGSYAEAGEDVVYVRDNGVGFDMRYVDKLFGVFQRLHSMEEFEGTGIGLANIRRIISRHGGRTWAEGTLGKGASFYFSLSSKKKDNV